MNSDPFNYILLCLKVMADVGPHITSIEEKLVKESPVYVQHRNIEHLTAFGFDSVYFVLKM